MKKLVIAFIFVSTSAFAQNASDKFRFTTDYYFLDLKGHVGHREQIVGTYTRDWSAKKVRWTDVSVENKKRDFMEGFSYALGSGDMTKAEFFKGLPAGAVQEQSLIWDSRMFEQFGEDHFKDLKLNATYNVKIPASIPLAGAGTFNTNETRLTWSGTTNCDGAQKCAVIDYRAFFNTFTLEMPQQQTLTGRSHYWGQIWVSLRTRRIVRATLYEDVLGEATASGSPKPQPVNAFRIGVFERVKE